jgi:hypothetical protein
MKDSKGRPVSEKKIEAALRRWEKLLKPLSEGIVRSERIGRDRKIRLY